MARRILFAGLAGLSLLLLAPSPAGAETDATTRALIERLKPRPGGSTRGIRLPPESAVLPVAQPSPPREPLRQVRLGRGEARRPQP